MYFCIHVSTTVGLLIVLQLCRLKLTTATAGNNDNNNSNKLIYKAP